MLQLRRKLKQRENNNSARVKPVESLERRQLLTAAPSLDGAGVNGTAHTAVIWFDASGDTGSDTVTFQEFDNSTSQWNNIGTTAGGGHVYVPLTSSFLISTTVELRAKATHLGVDSSWSNLINVESPTATPVEPTVENIQTFGSTTDYYFNWTGSTAYRESDTLVVQYATTGTGGTVWNDYTTTNATAAGPIDVNGLDFSQDTTMRISVENSNGQSSWNEFVLPALT